MSTKRRPLTGLKPFEARIAEYGPTRDVRKVTSLRPRQPSPGTLIYHKVPLTDSSSVHSSIEFGAVTVTIGTSATKHWSEARSLALNIDRVCHETAAGRGSSGVRLQTNAAVRCMAPVSCSVTTHDDIHKSCIQQIMAGELLYPRIYVHPQPNSSGRILPDLRNDHHRNEHKSKISGQQSAAGSEQRREEAIINDY